MMPGRGRIKICRANRGKPYFSCLSEGSYLYLNVFVALSVVYVAFDTKQTALWSVKKRKWWFWCFRLFGESICVASWSDDKTSAGIRSHTNVVINWDSLNDAIANASLIFIDVCLKSLTWKLMNVKILKFKIWGLIWNVMMIIQCHHYISHQSAHSKARFDS